MDDSVMSTIATVEELAPVVSALSAQAEKAFSEEETADALLLSKVITTVRPALHALVSPHRSRYRVGGDPNGIPHDEEEEYFEQRVVQVAGGGLQKQRVNAYSGRFAGNALFLTEEGEFFETTYSGEWSNFSGQERRWEASPLRACSVEDVAREWSVQSVVKGLADKLEKYAKGKIADRAAEARARAQRIVALASLL